MNKKRNIFAITDFTLPILMVLLFVCVIVISLSPAGDLPRNIILLNIMFIVMIFAYFFGVVAGLVSSVVVVFAMSSILLYDTLMTGVPINSIWYFWMFMIPATSATVGCFRINMQKMQDENNSLQKTVNDLTTIDEATGLYNLRAFNNDMQIFMRIAQRHNSQLALMLVRPRHYADVCRIIGSDRISIFTREFSKLVTSTLRQEDRPYLLDDSSTIAMVLMTDIAGGEIVRDRLKKVVQQDSFITVAPPIRLNVEANAAFMIYDDSVMQSPQDFKMLVERELEFDVDSSAQSTSPRLIQNSVTV